MKNRYRIVKLDGALIYGLAPMVVTVAAVFGLTYSPQPWPVWLLATIVVGTWLALCAHYWLLRWRFARSIEWYTQSGVGVILGHVSVLSEGHRRELVSVIEAAVSWWGSRFPGFGIVDYFDGALLEFVPHVIEYQVNGQIRTAVGLTTQGKHMTVSWLPTQTWEQVLATVRHECAHLALGCMGVWDEAAAHREMIETGWGL